MSWLFTNPKSVYACTQEVPIWVADVEMSQDDYNRAYSLERISKKSMEIPLFTTTTSHMKFGDEGWAARELSLAIKRISKFH